MKEPKIVFWDIECSPMQVRVWSLIGNNYISPENIIKDRSILCIAWKHKGKDKVHGIRVSDTNSERDVIERFRRVLDDVDILVAHNGDKFDLRHFNAKLIEYELPPLPPVQTIDTYKEQKRVAAFSSGKLDFLAKKLTGAQKLSTGMDLWVRCEAGEEAALKQMLRYCKHDVKVLEGVYDALAPYMKGHPNIADPGSTNCPRCNSSAFIVTNKFYRTKAGIMRLHLRCGQCGVSFTTRPVSDELQNRKSYSV